MSRKEQGRCAGILAIAAALGAPDATAQDKPERAELPEIVVTSQKYEQALQQTPLSVVAVDATQLEALGVSSLNGFDVFVPNVSIGGTMGQGNAMAAFSIRGIGGAASGFVTQESSVGVYIDDVLFARPNGALLDLLDVERVEVLRGPQGTLFGRNTAGGAVRYITRKPDFAGTSGKLSATVGERSRLDLTGSVNLPVNDTLAVRLSIGRKSQDGYITRLIDGDKTGDENSTTLRAQMRWKPIDRLDVNLSADRIRSHNDGSATITRDFSVTDNYIAAVYGAAATGIQARRLVPVSVLPNLANNLATGGSLAGYSTAAADVAYYQNRLTGPFQVFGGPQKDRNELESKGFSSTIAYDLTDDITVKALSGYREIDQIQNQDYDRTPLPLYGLNERIDIRYFTHELQVGGKSFSKRLNWVVGAFYYKDTAHDYRRRLGGSDISDTSFADDLSPLVPATTGMGLGALEQKFITTRSRAYFGQGTFSVTDKFSVTAGARWSKDEKDYTGFRENRGRVCVNGTTLSAPVSGACPTGTGTLTSIQHNATGDWSDFSPRLAVDYQWTPDLMTYVSASRGFKGGGLNDTLGTNCAAGQLTVCGLTEYKPENLWTYEAGLRSDLLDRRLRFNLTGFQTKYHDLQIQYIDVVPPAPPIARTLNGDATVKGFEFELMAAPMPGLMLRASGGYTDAKYDSDVVNPSGVVKITKTVPFFRSPKWSYSLGGDYLMNLKNGDNLAFDLNWGWKASQASSAIPTNMVILPSYGLLNGRVEYRAKSGWAFAAYGKNLLDKLYYPNGFDPGGPASQPSPGSTLAHDAVFGYSMMDVGAPRELGLQATYKF